MRAFHVYLKDGGNFAVFGKDYTFDIIALSIFDNHGRLIFTIKTEFLKLVRYFDPDCSIDYEAEKVIFHAM